MKENKMKIFQFIFIFFVIRCSSTIHLYTLYTESHRQLIENWFLPSINDSVIVHVYYVPQECPTGKYKQFGWKKTTIKKVEIIIEAIKRHKEGWFIYSDVDVQFFESIGNEMSNLLNQYDLVIQRDNPKGVACSGFFACRANEVMLELWMRVLSYMQKTSHSDQGALNYVLHHSKDLAFKWTLLPETYFGAGFFTGKTWIPYMMLDIPEGIKIHHANWTVGVENKIKQLALVWSIVKQRMNTKRL